MIVFGLAVQQYLALGERLSNRANQLKYIWRVNSGISLMRVPKLKNVIGRLAIAGCDFACIARSAVIGNCNFKRARRVISPAARGAPMQHEPEVQRLSASEQWGRITSVIATAIASTEEALRLQRAATQQLDLAQYAISALTDELSAVMAIPGRRERARVHAFEPAIARSSRAIAA